MSWARWIRIWQKRSSYILASCKLNDLLTHLQQHDCKLNDRGNKTTTVTITTTTGTITVTTISSKNLFLFFLVAPAVRRARTLARVTVEPPLSVNLNQVKKAELFLI
jgi:hypothetical protein